MYIYIYIYMYIYIQIHMYVCVSDHIAVAVSAPVPQVRPTVRLHARAPEPEAVRACVSVEGLGRGVYYTLNIKGVGFAAPYTYIRLRGPCPRNRSRAGLCFDFRAEVQVSCV